jgi:hypothetical protein
MRALFAGNDVAHLRQAISQKNQKSVKELTKIVCELHFSIYHNDLILSAGSGCALRVNQNDLVSRPEESKQTRRIENLVTVMAVLPYTPSTKPRE